MKKAMLLIMAVWISATASTTIPVENTPEDVSTRSIDEVREKVSDVKDTLQHTYELLLADEPGLSGEVEVSFSITPEGEVTEIVIVCSEGLESLEEPTLETVSALVFQPCPGQDENLPITVPFNLSPPQ